MYRHFTKVGNRVPDEARVVLAQLIQTHGQELAHDPRRLRAILADMLPGTAEAKRFVAAAEEGIPAQILSAGDDPTGAVRIQLARRLESERDMTAEAAGWTVDAWAAALGSDLGARTKSRPNDPTVPARPDPDDAPPPPSRRGLLIAAGLAGAAIAALLFFLLGPPASADDPNANATETPSATALTTEVPTPSPTPRLTPTPMPTPTPQSDALRELLSWIPADFRDTCVEANYSTVGNTRAQVDCRLRGTDGVTFLSYGRHTVLQDEYARYVHADNNSGSCPGGDLPSENGWHFADGITVGRYTCYRGEGRVWVVWTANYANLLAWTSRTDGNIERLYQIWKDDAGPNSP